MKTQSLIKISMQSIARNKTRTLLTMLGIIIGVAAVIAMVAIGEGAREQIEEKINNLGTNMIIITAGSSKLGGASKGAATFNRLTVQDAKKIRRESALVAYVSPVIVTRTQIISQEGNWRSNIYGVDTDYQVIRDWPMSSGVFFSENDVMTKRKVAVIGYTIAQNLFADSDPVGQKIRIRNVPVEIIGVLHQKGQTAEGVDQDDIVFLPHTTFNTRLGGWSFIRQILASTIAPEDVALAQDEVRDILRESHRLSAWEHDDFTIRNQNDLADAAEGTTKVMTILLAAIASISLLVGGIGIMNIMLVSVTERTREIGIRMAIGARGRDVLVQFLVESIVISVLGGLIGLLIGSAVTLIVASLTGWAVALSPKIVLLSLFFSISVGIFFGIYPARKASMLNPIESLRYE